MAQDEHLRLYKKRVDHVTRLLRSAIDSGRKGLAEGDITDVRKCASSTIRAYDSALLCSLEVSLTKWHCESIDEKSHMIELLLVALQARILELTKTQASAIAPTPRNGESDLPESVSLFLARCAKFRTRAEAMRKKNAHLMRRPPVAFWH